MSRLLSRRPKDPHPARARHGTAAEVLLILAAFAGLLFADLMLRTTGAGSVVPATSFVQPGRGLAAPVRTSGRVEIAR